MEGFYIEVLQTCFQMNEKESGESQKPTLLEYAGNIVEFEWYNQNFKSLYQGQKENVHFPPSLFSLGCMICVSSILEKPSHLHDYHLLSICHMPDAMQGT